MNHQAKASPAKPAHPPARHSPAITNILDTLRRLDADFEMSGQVSVEAVEQIRAFLKQPSPQSLVDDLLASAFHPYRDPRSPQYIAGARAILERHIVKREYVQPFAIGSAEADAFWSGSDEGRLIWSTFERVRAINALAAAARDVAVAMKSAITSTQQVSK